MRDRRLPNFLLALVVAATWAVIDCAPALASVPDSVAVSPDSVSTAPRDSVSAARPDSVSAAPSDSVSRAGADSTFAAPPDSASTSGKVVPKQSVLPDTLEFLPPPGSQTGEPKAGGAAGAPAAPKQRVGLLGIHPIAILVGIAALNYFIIKAVTN